MNGLGFEKGNFAMAMSTHPSLTNGNRTTLKISAWLAIAVGFICLITPFYAGLAATLLLGGYFIASGILEGIVAFRAPSWLGTIGLIVLAAISIVAGLFILANPLAGLVTITLVSIASIFIVGVAKLFWSLRVPSGKAILALSGILSILIAVMLYTNFPYSAAWTFGVLVGMNLMMEGALLLGFLNKEG
jgi:uncharacterized membrane protein HdeD (DUF308 family)